MELDALKAAWREHERKLDASVALNLHVARALELDRTRKAVRRSAALPLFELVCDAILVLLFGSFVGDHWREAAMLAPGLALLVGAIALVAVGLRQLALAAGIDYDAPVVAIQRDVERLAALRLAKIRAILLAVPLVWPLLLIVGTKGLLGIDAYAAFGVPFVAAQFAFGVVALLALVALGRHFSSRAFWRRLRNDVVGANLAAARTRLATIEGFERDG
jgi:hypothetical protein